MLHTAFDRQVTTRPSEPVSSALQAFRRVHDPSESGQQSGRVSYSVRARRPVRARLAQRRDGRSPFGPSTCLPIQHCHGEGEQWLMAGIRGSSASAGRPAALSKAWECPRRALACAHEQRRRSPCLARGASSCDGLESLRLRPRRPCATSTRHACRMGRNTCCLSSHPTRRISTSCRWPSSWAAAAVTPRSTRT
jgi:hypothetical protein